jgi:tetratricopeptide (TPR) repeat protein
MVPQTAADLGLLGLLVLLALALTWLTAAARLAGAAFKPPWRWLTTPDEDRLAALALTACALVFGVHSAVDWVWFLPAVAYFGLVCGGWTLGTPAAHPAWLAENQGSTAQVSDKTRTLTAVAITVVGLLLAYGVYQPVRASQKVGSGLHVAQTDPGEALELGRAALALDPTSAHAQMLIATAQNNADRPRAAEHTLLALVRQQPGNPEAWLRLAQFRLTQLHDPDGAIEALRPIFYTTQHYTAAHNLLAAARTAKAYEALERIAEKKRRELRRQLTVLEKLQQQP